MDQVRQTENRTLGRSNATLIFAICIVLQVRIKAKVAIDVNVTPSTRLARYFEVVSRFFFFALNYQLRLLRELSGLANVEKL